MVDVPEQGATDEAGSVPAVAPTADGKDKQEPRKFLGLARRDLSEDELSTPAARRFLIAEIERLDIHCSGLIEVQTAFHELRVEHAKLSEVVKKDRWSEILAFVCLSAGSVGIGGAASYVTVPNYESVGFVILGVSFLLVVTGVISRIKK